MKTHGAVIILFHINEEVQDRKLIGVFSTTNEADAARAQVVLTPGFREQPFGFWMVHVPLNVLNLGGFA